MLQISNVLIKKKKADIRVNLSGDNKAKIKKVLKKKKHNTNIFKKIIKSIYGDTLVK